MVSPRLSSYELVELATVPQAKFTAFQVETAKRDPLFRPLPLVRFENGLAVLNDEGLLAGVAWGQQSDAGTFLDIRVSVSHRRQGVGSLLLASLRSTQGPVYALCEAGKRGAISFLAHHGFAHDTSVFAYRWDGEPVDVPPSFKTAAVKPIQSGFARWEVDRAKVFSVLPRTIQTIEPSPTDEFIGFEAELNGEIIGAVTAVKGYTDFGLMSFWIEPEFRSLGIGRLLLCALLEDATRRQAGVVVHLDAEQETIGARMKGLGMWAYRTWHCFRAV